MAREIGKSSGYKISELESMEEGQSLLIGGKEIEVMGRISREDYHAGKCFQSVTATSLDHKTLPQVSTKAFSNPQKSKTMNTPSSVPKPLYDPSTPNALILPRPSSTHQWQHNSNQAIVVDVVADPYLVCKLRPHQREGVTFLYECVMGLRAFNGHGAILADDMGLGKTLQCITLIWTLLKQGPYNGKPMIKRILVVTPGSLVKNWCHEFNKWLGKERVNVFGVGSDKKIQEFLHSPIYPVMVVSYEMAVRYYEDLHKIKFDLMVCDEAHRLKSSSIKTTSILNSLSIKRRILLTGTPIQNDLKEFYSLAEFCNPSILGTESSFHRLYEEPVLRSRQPNATEEEKQIGKMRAEEPLPQLSEIHPHPDTISVSGEIERTKIEFSVQPSLIQLSRIMAMFVLRRTQEVNNKYLPPKVESVIFCKPMPLQLSLYRSLLASRLVRRCLTRGITGDSTAPHLICIGALKKLCNHPSLLYESSRRAAEENEANKNMYGDEEEVSLYDGLLPLFPSDYNIEHVSPSESGKLMTLAAMLRVLHTSLNQEKIVIVSNYTQTLDVLQTYCETEGYKVSRLDGTTPTSKRQQIVDHFNSKHSKESIFLLSSKAGGVGLNLIGASRLILYDIDWNPANDLQSMARVWRDGQRKQVHIYRLITAGTVEEKIFQRQISKQGLSGAVVDVHDRSEVKFSLEDLKDLFTLHEDVSCLTHDMLNCHCSADGSTVTEEEVTEVRPCQLGKLASTSASKKKTVSMAQLLKWKHYSYPFKECFDDDLLKATDMEITFMFQNETNMFHTSGSTV